MKKSDEQETSEILNELKELKEYQTKENLMTPQIEEFLKFTYDSTITKHGKNFDKKEKTLEQIAEFSSFAIERADSIVVSYLLLYSGDVTGVDYEIPESKLRKMKKNYMTILMCSDEDFPTLNEMFYTMFYVAYSIPVKNAIQHREEVLKLKSERANGQRIPQ